MRIAVIGTGYVGLVTGVCFSEMGNDVICVDINEEKIDNLNKGNVPIYEPGLQELIQKNYNKTLFFTTNASKAIEESDILFIAVGTPMAESGKADLSAVFDLAKQIGKVIKTDKIIVSKSTVPVGTTHRVKEIVQSEIDKRKVQVNFEVVSNPEFLKEGDAINDFMKPDRIVIGAEKDFVFKKMKELYAPFFRTHNRFIEMDVFSAEMTKYAANAMLATKISFINEMANICEKTGADINKVRVGIGSDSRIGYNFIYPGIGYGGTCFPKDISALIEVSKENCYTPELISAVKNINKKQKEKFFKKITKYFGEDLSGLVFGIWGLSFKPETDDMREAPSVYVIKMLLSSGAKVKVYDPKAMEVAKKYYFNDSQIFYAESKYEAAEAIDALLLLTEWKEFRSPDFKKLHKQMKQNVIFDGRNQYKNLKMEEIGFEYFQIGVKQNSNTKKES